jgi:hypothetical protein
MKKNRSIRIDYSILSSYMGRSATVVVFAFIIAIALGALFLEENDMAHVPITIGVCAMDSARSWDALESLSRLIREKGLGDITWCYLDHGAAPAGCDFYLMTSVQGAPHLVEGDLECSLIVTVRSGARYARGGVIVRKGTSPESVANGTVLFTSPVSATGYLSPLSALAEAGYAVDSMRCEFAGSSMGEEAVAFGVLFGAYDAGGINLERFRFLEQHSIVPPGELTVLLEGASMPEMIIAANPAADPRKRRVFRERLPVILERMPRLLMADLAGIGIAGFVAPREEDVAFIESLSSYRAVSSPATRRHP